MTSNRPYAGVHLLIQDPVGFAATDGANERTSNWVQFATWAAARRAGTGLIGPAAWTGVSLSDIAEGLEPVRHGS